ncbi:MAG: cell division protein FtsQ/DivIB [Leeuwenhoekiella sp.]
MKVNWFYIKMTVLIVITVFLFGFSARRSTAKKIEGVQVNFETGNNLFITAAEVDKLLIQSDEHLTGKDKEALVLKTLEQKLNANAMIAHAEVYMTLNGIVGANIEQRKPLARIEAQIPYYLDETGSIMPLSPNYSARVPIINGVDKDNISEVFPLVEYIKNDELLNKQIIGLTRHRNGTYTLTPRIMDYRINLGKTEGMESKFNNYKAFYQKTLKDDSLEKYSLVDLRFKGQVVGTKK